MTPQQQEEVDLSGLALDSARADMYSCAGRITALEAEIKAAKVEYERLGCVVVRAEIALSRAKKRGET